MENFQKWNKWMARKIEEEVTYEVKWELDLNEIKYVIFAILSFKNDVLYKVVVKEATYIDPLGSIKVNDKVRAKIKRLIKQYLVGTPQTGLYFNRGFKAKLKKIIPQGGEDESLLGYV